MSRSLPEVFGVPVPEEMVTAFLHANYNFPQVNTVIVLEIALAYLKLQKKLDLLQLLQMKLSDRQLDRIQNEARGFHQERDIGQPDRERFLMLWDQQMRGVLEFVVRLWNALGGEEVSSYWLSRHIGTLGEAPESSLDSIRSVLKPIQRVKSSDSIFKLMKKVLQVMITAAYGEAKIAGEHAGRVATVARHYRREALEVRRSEVQRAALEGGLKLIEAMRRALAENFPDIKSFF